MPPQDSLAAKLGLLTYSYRRLIVGNLLNGRHRRGQEGDPRCGCLATGLSLEKRVSLASCSCFINVNLRKRTIDILLSPKPQEAHTISVQ